MVRSSDMMMFWMFAEKIKTEWIILNIIIWTILLMTLTSTNPKDIKNNLINLRENLLNRNKYNFTLSFTIFIGPYCRNKNHIDTSILGILHYITQNKIDIKNKCSFEISKNKYSSDGEIICMCSDSVASLLDSVRSFVVLINLQYILLPLYTFNKNLLLSLGI